MKATFFEVEKLFEPIAQAVSDFADGHGFRLKKCARGNSGWELVRNHAGGGELYLLLMYDSELGLGIGSVWQFPCLEMSLLYNHFRQIRKAPIESQAVVEFLSEELEAISAVKFGYWTHIQPLQSQNDA